MAKTIRVRAAAGRTMRLPRGVAKTPGVFTITPETPVEVFFNRYARRRLQSGDWEEVEGGDEPGEPETVDLDAQGAPEGERVRRLIEPAPRRPMPLPPADDGEEG